MTKTYLNYTDAGYAYDTWVKEDIDFNDARQLNSKAQSLWDTTFEALKSEFDNLEMRKMYALERYGRTLFNMFDCVFNSQPTPIAKQMILLFLEGWCNMFEYNMDEAKRIVDVGLREYSFLTKDPA